MGLTDSQLAAVIDAARTLPVEKRDLYLQRVAAMLTMRGRGHFTDSDVADVAKLAIAGLCQTADTVSDTLTVQRTHQRSPLGQCGRTYAVPRSKFWLQIQELKVLATPAGFEPATLSLEG
jgi:hypothetical protein